MPLALRDLQAAFAAHVMGADRADLVAAVVGDTIPAAARLSVYRHHVFESLGTALAATFPTVQALVGMDFFRGLARAFVRHSLPLQPVLTEYGADFPAFVASHEAARDLPYLADVARLDWALNLAFHAPLGGRLQAEELSAVPAERLPSMSLALAAGAVLLSSRYPLDRIWETSQPGAANETVDLNSGAANLLVLRRPDDAAFVSLSAGEAAFMAALTAGMSLERAARAAFRADPAFELSTSFARLLALGAFAALQ
jgi:putative DNA-binding protein